MIKVRQYDDQEANRLAKHFFTYEYHDPGIQKWGGFRTDHWGAILKQEQEQQKKLK